MDFAVASAMRLGEICRIEHEDIGPDGRTILIRDRKDPRRKEGNHQRVPLSSRAREIIAAQEREIALIEAWLAQHAPQ